MNAKTLYYASNVISFILLVVIVISFNVVVDLVTGCFLIIALPLVSAHYEKVNHTTKIYTPDVVLSRYAGLIFIIMAIVQFYIQTSDLLYFKMILLFVVAFICEIAKYYRTKQGH